MAEACFPAHVFRDTHPSQLSQDDWLNDEAFLDVLRNSWSEQYADYIGSVAAQRHVALLDRQGKLFSHHQPLTIQARVKDRIVGISALRPLGPLALITMLEVHPDFQGRGIGKQLIHALESTGVRLMAHVSIHRPRVLSFYTGLGFHVLKRELVEHGPHLLEFDVVARSLTRNG